MGRGEPRRHISHRVANSGWVTSRRTLQGEDDFSPLQDHQSAEDGEAAVTRWENSCVFPRWAAEGRRIIGSDLSISTETFLYKAGRTGIDFLCNGAGMHTLWAR